MADSNINVNTDAKRSNKEFATLASTMERLAGSVIKTQKATTTFNKEGEKNRRVVETQKTTAQQLVKEYKSVDGQLKLISKTLIDNTAKIKAEERAQAKLQKQLKSSTQTARNFLKGIQTPVTNSATQAELLRLRNVESELLDLGRRHKFTFAEIATLWRRIANGDIRTYDTRLKALQNQLVKIRTAQSGLGAQARKEFNQAAKAAKKVKTGLAEINLSWQTLIRIATVQTLQRAFFNLQQGIADSVKLAAELQVSIAEVQTIDVSNQAFSVIADDLRRLSDNYNGNILDQAEAQYQALSNQVVTAAESFEFLETANRLAIATVSDTSEAVEALSSIINAYNIPASRAEEISAKLFTTVELGRTRLDEMSNRLGQIAVVASQVGVSLDELLAFIDTTTVQGLKTSEAFTQIRGTMIALLKPTKAMTEFLNDLGFASGQQAVETLGLIGVMEKLAETTDGNVDQVAKLVPRIRGLTGTLSILKNEQALYRSNLEKTTASTERFNQAVDTVLNNIGKKFQLEIERIKNFFIQDIGFNALSAIVSTTEAMGGLSNVVNTVTKFIIATAVPAFTLLTAALIKMAIAMAVANPAAALLGVALAAISVAIYTLVEAEAERRSAIDETFRRVKEATTKEIQAYEEVIDTRINGAQRVLDTVKRLQNQETAEVLQEIAKRKKAYETYFETLDEKNKSLTKGLDKSNKESTNQLKQQIAEAEKELNRLKQVVEQDIPQTFEQLKIDRFNQEFELRLEGTETTEKKLALVQERLANLVKFLRNANDEDTFQKINVELEKTFQIYNQLQAELNSGEDGQNNIEQQINNLNRLTKIQVQELRRIEQLEKDRFERQKQELRELYKLERQLNDAIFQVKVSQEQTLQALRKGSVEESIEAAKQLATALNNLRQVEDDAGLLSNFGDTQEFTDNIVKQFEAKKAAEELAEAQKQLAETQKEVVEQNKEVTNSLEEQKNAIIDSLQPLQKAQELLQELLQAGELNNSETYRGEGFNGQVESLRVFVKTAEDLKNIEAPLNRVIEALLRSEDIDSNNLEQAFNSALNLAKQFTQQGSTSRLGEVFTDLAVALNKVGDSSVSVKKLTEELEEIKRLEDNINLTQEEINKRLQAPPKEVNNWKSETDKLIDKYERLSEIINNINTQLQNLPPIPPTGDGVEERASGGFFRSTSGNDTRLVGVAPDEITIPSRESRQFFTQLQAIKAGVNPATRQSSTPSSSIDIGGITINEASNPQAIGRGVVSELRRAQRLGQI